MKRVISVLQVTLEDVTAQRELEDLPSRWEARHASSALHHMLPVARETSPMIQNPCFCWLPPCSPQDARLEAMSVRFVSTSSVTQWWSAALIMCILAA